MLLKKQFLFLAVILVSYTSMAQRLIVHDLDENQEEVGNRDFTVGDIVVIAHQKPGKKVHYFQGKVTGIFKDRNVVRVFDYARSTRVVSIAGKKIDISEIAGIEKIDDSKFKSRENKAVGAAVAGVIGSSLGGSLGNAIQYGSSAAAVTMDVTTRERIAKQRINVEISEY